MNKKKLLEYVLMYLKIVLGSALYAFGFQYFLFPNNVVASGVVGISTIINYLTGFPVGIMTIIINIPLFLISWRQFGLKFIVSSGTAMLVSSLLMDAFAMMDFAATHDPLLAAVYGGVIRGLGLGILYSTGATAGGTDIIAKLLRRKYQYINFSTFLLGMDVVIFLAFAILFGKLDSAMYSAICMFIASHVIDIVLYGAVNSKVCYIITDESKRIKDAIVGRLRRGVTYIHGEGAWSGKQKNIILCVIKRSQIVELKKLIRQIDENAFLIVSDSREVFGKGFTYIGDDS